LPSHLFLATDIQIAAWHMESSLRNITAGFLQHTFSSLHALSLGSCTHMCMHGLGSRDLTCFSQTAFMHSGAFDGVDPSTAAKINEGILQAVLHTLPEATQKLYMRSPRRLIFGEDIRYAHGIARTHAPTNGLNKQDSMAQGNHGGVPILELSLRFCINQNTSASSVLLLKIACENALHRIWVYISVQ
jgi:hypothetical protein